MERPSQGETTGAFDFVIPLRKVEVRNTERGEDLQQPNAEDAGDAEIFSLRVLCVSALGFRARLEL